jgi:hypothetical protein
MPFSARGTTEHAQDVDNAVADNHSQHCLPDVEPQGDQGRAGCPSADVERARDDPERNKFPGAKGSSFRLEGTSVEVGAVGQRMSIVVLDLDLLEKALNGSHREMQIIQMSRLLYQGLLDLQAPLSSIYKYCLSADRALSYLIISLRVHYRIHQFFCYGPISSLLLSMR